MEDNKPVTFPMYLANFWGAKIETVPCVKVTSSFAQVVSYDGRHIRREALRSNSGVMFKTRGEAIACLMGRLEADVDRAKDMLKYQEDKLNRAKKEYLDAR